jgi:hypothetical protein
VVRHLPFVGHCSSQPVTPSAAIFNIAIARSICLPVQSVQYSTSTSTVHPLNRTTSPSICEYCTVLYFFPTNHNFVIQALYITTYTYNRWRICSMCCDVGHLFVFDNESDAKGFLHFFMEQICLSRSLRVACFPWIVLPRSHTLTLTHSHTHTHTTYVCIHLPAANVSSWPHWPPSTT